MNVTTKGHYSLMAMAELAMHHGEGPVSLKAVAESQGLSEHYLEQLFGPLRRAGLVRSVRGAAGGYMLAKEPREISVGDVLRVLEGSLAPIERPGETQGEGAERCANPYNCVVREVWEKLQKTVERVVDGITLADLRDRARELQSRENPMFYI